jgi:hypothetical protein
MERGYAFLKRNEMKLYQCLEGDMHFLKRNEMKLYQCPQMAKVGQWD